MSTINQIQEECPSICIPRVFKHISVSFIIDIFQNKLKLGLIKKIDIIPNNIDKNFKKVFIHFDFWYDNDYVNNIKHKFIQETIIKIVYDGPWFWKCALNRIRNNSKQVDSVDPIKKYDFIVYIF